MVEVVKREKSHFRIQIYDLPNHKSRLITLKDHKNISLDEIFNAIVKCMEKL
jgi:hypothetical protein